MANNCGRVEKGNKIGVVGRCCDLKMMMFFGGLGKMEKWTILVMNLGQGKGTDPAEWVPGI